MNRAHALAVVPTARAISWSPLVAAAVCLLAVGVVSQVGASRSDGIALMGVATLAAAVVMAVHDPAARLLAAVPVTAMSRRLTRLGLALVPAAAVWLVVVVLVAGGSSSLADGAAALVLSGLALATWLPHERDARIAAVLPPAWVVLHLVLGDSAGLLGEVASWWATHPLTVAAASLALVIAGRHR